MSSLDMGLVVFCTLRVYRKLRAPTSPVRVIAEGDCQFGRKSQAILSGTYAAFTLPAHGKHFSDMAR